tara:strand:+ start:132 stop:1175 length:1044 start_codon:yes stop_codon:yes gene_type:complete
MIKLYDLVFEDIEKNNIDLGDKTEEFQKKLELMKPEDQKLLIPLVVKLNDSEKKELGSLLNKYSSVFDLQAPKTSLQLQMAKNLVRTGMGPGEILFHLELQDSSMVGDTNHDLTVKGKVWEVKKVGKKGGPFRAAKKGKIGKFTFNKNLVQMVSYLDKVTNALPQLGDDFDEISSELFDSLKKWDQLMTSFSPQEAILQGELSNKIRDYMIKLINTIKSEIEVNTDDEFTTVKFGGINITPTDRSIDPVNIQKIDDDSVILNFIKRDTLKVLEILNELPYIGKGDFNMDLDTAVSEILEVMPSIIIFDYFGKMIVLDEDNLREHLTIATISQGDLQLKVKSKIWNNL